MKFSPAKYFRRNSPFYLVGFLLLVGVPQLFAIIFQFKMGFSPFVHDPVRVPFSWDMFSNRVERCGVTWDPPLQGPLGALSSLRQFGTTMEFDIIYDHIDQYRGVAQWLCGMGGPHNGSRIRLRCFVPKGTEIDDELACL